MSSELEKLLEDHRNDGAFDSSGVFTLDREGLTKTLGESLLPEPHAYILKLVQWAVASGAKKIKIEIGPRKVLFAHDGWPLSKDWLLNWQDCLLEGRTERQLGYFGELPDLALAIQALQSLQTRKISFMHRGPGGGTDVVFDQEGDWFREDESLQSPGHVNVICIEGRTLHLGSALAKGQYQFESSKQPAIWGLSRLRATVDWAEKSLLYACCVFCPVPLKVNGRYVNRPFFGHKPSYSTAGGKLDCQELGLRIYESYRFLYGLCPEPHPKLMAPSYHPGARLSAWYAPDNPFPLANFSFPVRRHTKAMANYIPDSGFLVMGSPPANASIMLCENETRTPKRQGRVTAVVRGVSIETDVEPWMPTNSYTLLSEFGLQTDLSGLRIAKDQSRHDKLKGLADKL